MVVHSIVFCKHCTLIFIMVRFKNPAKLWRNFTILYYSKHWGKLQDLTLINLTSDVETVYISLFLYTITSHFLNLLRFVCHLWSKSKTRLDWVRACPDTLLKSPGLVNEDTTHWINVLLLTQHTPVIIQRSLTVSLRSCWIIGMIKLKDELFLNWKTSNRLGENRLRPLASRGPLFFSHVCFIVHTRCSG